MQLRHFPKVFEVLQTLLFHFLKTACDVAERIDIFAVDVFSKDDDAKAFYLKYGFLELQDDPFHLYLPIATVRQMFQQETEEQAIVRQMFQQETEEQAIT